MVEFYKLQFTLVFSKLGIFRSFERLNVGKISKILELFSNFCSSNAFEFWSLNF